MKTMRILGICGSLQARSSNLDLLQTAVAAAPPGVEVVLFDGIRDLPHFNPDLEDEAPAPALETWRRALAESDAVLIASPEYAFSLPGALKNAIDWTIGSAEFDGKIVAITANVNHVDRGRRGLKTLRETLGAANVTLVADEPIVRGPTFEASVAALLKALVAAVEERRLAQP
jgi:chromate reductase, NAD(P)H dehydrogenase (quinone)